MVRRLFAYGIRSHASTMPSQLNQNLRSARDLGLSHDDQLGVYVVAVTMTSLTALFGSSVAYAALPNVAGLPQGQRLSGRRLVTLTLLISGAISLIIIVARARVDPLAVRGSIRPRSGRRPNPSRRGGSAVGKNRDQVESCEESDAARAGIAEIVALAATDRASVFLPLLGLTQVQPFRR